MTYTADEVTYITEPTTSVKKTKKSFVDHLFMFLVTTIFTCWSMDAAS